ncbi:MAG: spore Coat Protein domain protein [Sphingomonas bacterium]|nr:spore Coat Protein domain protein [Sphingomonas bacterium]
MIISARTTRFSALGIATLLTAATFGIASMASAAETSSTMGVSATVTSNCAVSTTPIAFGNIDVTTGTAVDNTGGISVTCTNGTAWAAAADAGLGVGGTITTRKMTSGSDLLNYGLYTDSGHTTVWGDGTDGSTTTGTGTGTAQATTIYGRVLASQNAAPAGSYADTVAVTLTY